MSLPYRNRSLLWLLPIAAVVGVIAVAGLTPAGAAVGMLACIPVLLGSLADDRRQVWLTGGIGIAGFLLAAFWGEAVWGATWGASAWALGESVTLTSLCAALGLALLLQEHRLEAVAARNAAVSASELNRLLMSLLAHDLRSPLALADQGFQYVEESASGGYPVDRNLVADLRARLQRSLRAIEIVLSLARAEAEPDTGTGSAESETALAGAMLSREIREEITSFAYEAETRGKQLVAELEELGSGRYRVHSLVLRQALAILLDNAVRYALPGVIRVQAAVFRSMLELGVEDAGPGLSAHRTYDAQPRGSGLGLRLCEALLTRAGGSLHVERDAPSGTRLVIRLPIAPIPAHPSAAPAAPAAVPPPSFDFEVETSVLEPR